MVARKKAYEIVQKDSLSRSKSRHYLTVWSFLALAVVFGVVGFNAYINNSREAKRLYDQLISTDKAGGDVEKSLTELRTYMYSHMNTKIGGENGVKPPIQLKGTYDRLLEAEKARVATAKDANAGLYTTAQQVCEKENPTGLSGRGRVPCIEAYVTTHSQPETEQSIPAGLYQFDFAVPLWSPDLAGISLALSVVFLLVFTFRWLTYRRVLHHLHMSS